MSDALAQPRQLSKDQKTSLVADAASVGSDAGSIRHETGLRLTDGSYILKILPKTIKTAIKRMKTLVYFAWDAERDCTEHIINYQRFRELSQKNRELSRMKIIEFAASI